MPISALSDAPIALRMAQRIPALIATDSFAGGCLIESKPIQASDWPDDSGP